MSGKNDIDRAMPTLTWHVQQYLLHSVAVTECADEWTLDEQWWKAAPDLP